MLLSNTLVIDATDRFGWLGGRILGDLGAEVIKLDPPRTNRSLPAWRAFNINKRALDLDPAAEESQRELDALLERTDICLVSPNAFDFAGRLDPQRLRELYPRMIVVAASPFGAVGPRRNWRATDIEVMAAGGAMFLAGEPDGSPLRVGIPQSYGWSGAQAANGALVALFNREATGRGDLVDVSAQSSVVSAIAHAPAFYDILGTEPRRAGAFMTGRSIHGARYRVFWPCRDGWLNFIFYGGAAGMRTNEGLVAWMRERGAELGPLADIDWRKFDPTKATQAEVDALEAPVTKFFAGVAMLEFLSETHKREMLGYPVSDVASIAADPQLEARGFFETLPGTDGKPQTYCGNFVVIDGKRPSLRRAGSVEAPPAAPKTVKAAKPAVGPAVRGALADLKVVCFGGYAAGPHIGKVLGNFGARVVHVESKDHPDGFRLQYPPFADNRHGVNRSGCFSYFNDSKYGVTIDLKKKDGVELARRLVGWSDVVIENMRPGVMARLGLGFETLRKFNPKLVMLSTCNMGQTGPRADQPGFGSQLSALGGFCGMTGFPDGPPMLLYGPYIDFIASSMGGAAALAALIRARREEKSAMIDVSQYECGVTFIAGAMQDYFTSGTIAKRCGNDDRVAAPHGAFECQNGQWVALSCWSDTDFVALARTMERADLATDDRFATVAARHSNKQQLDQLISAWTGRHAALAVAERLQAAGVAAYPVVTVAGLFSDPQLAARRQWRVRRHPEIGDQSYCFPGFDLEETPGDIVGAAPCLGADNDFVFRELVKLTEAEMKNYAEKGVFG